MNLVKCPNLSKVLLFQGGPLEGGANESTVTLHTCTHIYPPYIHCCNQSSDVYMFITTLYLSRLTEVCMFIPTYLTEVQSPDTVSILVDRWTEQTQSHHIRDHQYNHSRDTRLGRESDLGREARE